MGADPNAALSQHEAVFDAALEDDPGRFNCEPWRNDAMANDLECQPFGAWLNGSEGLSHVAFFPNYPFARDDQVSKATLLVNVAMNEVIRCQWLDRSWDQPTTRAQ